MAVPIAARDVAAVVGALLVLTAAVSVVGTLIVPRSVASWLTRWVGVIVSGAFNLITSPIANYKQRDRILAAEAATFLISQLVAWLIISFIGYTLLVWPFTSGGITSAVTLAGPAVFGPNDALGAAERIIADLAAGTALIIVTLQIAYLPTLYSAFNRRETDVALLNARAGVPSWGPELLARTHYALGSGVSSISTLPQLYADWERWAADATESHTTYLPLVRFRSQKPLSSWVISLLAVLDSAALFLALSPEQAPTVPARLCLRSGFLCFNSIAQAMGFDVPEEPDPGASITITYEEFLDAIARMEKVNFKIERSAEEAWPDFVGWRLNYERSAYAIAEAIDAVPGLWSGPRRIPHDPIPPFRPPSGRTSASGGAADTSPIPDDDSTSVSADDDSTSDSSASI